MSLVWKGLRQVLRHARSYHLIALARCLDETGAIENDDAFAVCLDQFGAVQRPHRIGHRWPVHTQHFHEQILRCVSSSWRSRIVNSHRASRWLTLCAPFNAAETTTCSRNAWTCANTKARKEGS